MITSKAKIASDLLNTFKSVSMGISSTKAVRWMDSLSEQQLHIIKSVFSNFDDKPEYEQALLGYMLYPLRDGKKTTEGLYDTLVLHRAFIVPKVIKNEQYSFTAPQQIALGLRENITRPLNLKNPQKRSELEALAAFAFEVYGRAHTNAGSAFRNAYSRRSALQYIAYADSKLKQVVLRYADRMDQLMHYAVTRSLDADLLEMLMNEDNGTALNDGQL